MGDYIVMQNKSFDKKAPMSGSHVISSQKADQLRKDNNIVKKNNTATIDEKVKAVADIFSKMPFDSENGIDVKKMEEIKTKIQNRILRSREGLIDWKDVLMDFASERSMEWEENDELDKIVYDFSDIGIYGRERKQRNFKKCVIYIDTSQSVNNNTTQLIPIMAGEVGKIVSDCNFETVDIHLFHHVVYDNNRYVDVPADDVQNEDFAIEDVEDGLTNIQKVYDHILNNYTSDSVLDDDVNAIIIITDYSGMISSGNIHKKINKFDDSILSKILYVIYNDFSHKNLQEVREEMNKFVSEYSTHFEISLDAFRKQIMNENINNKFMRRIKLNEVAGGRRGKAQVAQIDIKKLDDIDNIELTSDQVEKIISDSEFETYRSLGKLDELDVTKNIIAALDKFNPSLQSVDDYQFVLKQSNTYFVYMTSNGFEVVLNSDINNLNWLKFEQLCDSINLNMLVGNVKLTDSIFKAKCPTFIDGDLPKGFPKKVLGNFELFKLTNLTNPGNFENFPTDITGDKNKIYLIGSWSQEIQNNLAVYVSKNNIKNMFIGQQKSKYGNVAEEISRRIAMGESYINEALGAPGNALRNIFNRGNYPQRSKYKDELDKWDNAVSDFLSSDMKKIEKNNKHFFDLLFNSGNATKEKENSEKKLEEINRQIDFLRRKISNGDKNKNTENELDALTKYRNKIERKVDNLSNVNKNQSTSILNIDWHRIPADNVQLITNISKVREDVRNVSDNKVEQLGKGYAKNVGLKIFVDSNDKISAIYGTFSKERVGSGDRYDKPQIIALSSDSGEPVSNPIEIRKLIKDRYDYIFGEVKEKLKDNTGVELSNITNTYRFDTKDTPKPATLKSFALNIMYNIITILHGSDGAVKYSYKLDNILNPYYYDGKNDITTDLILDYIFGSDYKGFVNNDRSAKLSKDASINNDNIIIKGTSVNFNNRTKNNQIYKYNWYDVCYNASQLSSDHTIFELFSNIFIKSLLIGSSIRDEVENSPIYGHDEIVKAYDDNDRETLIDMISKVENVELVSTSLKGLSVTHSVLLSKDKSKIKADTPIPFNAMLLFPDKCVKEYKIDIDVKDAVEARSAYSRRRTLTRGRLKFDKEPSNPNEYFNALYDVYSNIYSLTDPNNSENIIDDIKSTINGLESYDQDKLYNIANKLIDEGSWDDMNLIDEIQNGLIRKLRIANNLSRIIAGNLGDANFTSFADNHESEIESLYNIGLELVDNIAYIQLNNSTDDVINNIEAVNDNVKAISKVVENIFGSNYKENIAFVNQAERREKRKTLASRNKNKNFDDLVKKLADASNIIGDMAGQDQELSETIGNLLDNVISSVNTIKLNGDYDFVEQNSINDKLNNILNICNNIKKFSSDTERVYDLFDDLAFNCRKLVRIFKNYDSTRSEKANFAV